MNRSVVPASAHRLPHSVVLAALIPLAAVLALTGSCELLVMRPPAPGPHAVFDEVWTFADTHYSYFDLKEIDWDAVRAQYRPLVRRGMTDVELFDLLADMLYELRDGHVNLRSPFDLSRYWEWYLDHPPNFDGALLEREYFRGDQEYAGPFVLYDFLDTREQNIGYARYASFADAVTAAHLDYLFERFAGRDGLIIDVRNNGGGSSSNGYRIAGRFVTERTVRGFQEYKDGPGRDDFTPPQEVVIAPPASGPRWSKPVVVLTNRSSYSATNLFVALVKGLPGVTVMGDTTGGGGGIPAFTELSNGWIVRVSAHRLSVADWLGAGEWRDVELGVDPDVEVHMAAAGEAGNEDGDRDTIIETALQLLAGP